MVIESFFFGDTEIYIHDDCFPKTEDEAQIRKESLDRMIDEILLTVPEQE